MITYNIATFVDSVVWMTTRTDERKTPENALQQKNTSLETCLLLAVHTHQRPISK